MRLHRGVAGQNRSRFGGSASLDDLHATFTRPPRLEKTRKKTATRDEKQKTRSDKFEGDKVVQESQSFESRTTAVGYRNWVFCTFEL